MFLAYKHAGGNGGRGGDVILECSRSIWDFSSLQHHMVCFEDIILCVLPEINTFSALIAVPGVGSMSIKKNCVLVDKLRLNTVELEKAIPDFIKEPKVSYHSVA